MSTPQNCSTPSIWVNAGTTLRLAIQWVDWSGNNVDPDSNTQVLVIQDSHGDVVETIESDDPNLVRVSVGNFYYAYTTPTLTANDTYLAQWFAKIAGEADTPRFYFGIIA